MTAPRSQVVQVGFKNQVNGQVNDGFPPELPDLDICQDHDDLDGRFMIVVNNSHCNSRSLAQQ